MSINLQNLVVDALKYLGGSGTIIQVAEHIWKNNNEKLSKSGNVFYTWQYDMRWAATKLRQRGVMLQAKESPQGKWILKK